MAACVGRSLELAGPAPGGTVPPMVDVVFVAPYCSTRPRGSSACRARCPASGSAWSAAIRSSGCPRRCGQQLAGHWRVDDCLDPGQLAEAVAGLAGQLGRSTGWSASSRTSRCRWRRCARRSASTGMDVRDRPQLPRQGADEGRCFEPAGVPCARHQLVRRRRRGAGVRRRGRVPVRRQAAGRRRARNTFRLDDADALRGWLAGAPPTPDTRCCSRSSSSATSTPSTASSSTASTVWHSIAATCRPARGAAQPVDPVVRAAAARHRRPGVRRHPAVGPAALGRSA